MEITDNHDESLQYHHLERKIAHIVGGVFRMTRCSATLKTVSLETHILRQFLDLNSNWDD
jgi:hypothetical protein